MGVTDFKNMIGNELRAVGISPEGALFPVRSADSLRGVRLSGLIVGIRHRAWFKEHEESLRLSLPDDGKGGQVIIFGGADSIAEAF
jgi:hypothetical protein